MILTFGLILKKNGIINVIVTLFFTEKNHTQFPLHFFSHSKSMRVSTKRYPPLKEA